MASAVPSRLRASPLVATMTGSKTTGISRGRVASSAATRSTSSGVPSMPILTASTPMSSTTERNCAVTISSGRASTPCTPSVFCAVIAVIAVIAWPPSMVTVLMSAWMPAPPPESDPAMIKMRAVVIP
jgi:hypothetical protein